MAAGDVLLDNDGNVMLDDEGRVILSDGVGDECCCGEQGPCDHACGCSDVTAFFITWEIGAGITVEHTVTRVTDTRYTGTNVTLECVGGRWVLTLDYDPNNETPPTCTLAVAFCSLANGCPATGEDPRSITDAPGYEVLTNSCDVAINAIVIS